MCRFHINPFQTISISFQFSYNCQWPPCWPHPYIPNQPRYQEGLSFNNITVWNDLKRFEMNFKWFTYRNLTLKPTRHPWGLVSFMNSFELEYFDRNMQMRFKFISIHLNFISIQTKSAQNERICNNMCRFHLNPFQTISIPFQTRPNKPKIKEFVRVCADFI